LRGLTALGQTIWDMPVGYDKLRLKMATQGVDHENVINILQSKINVLGGMNYISVDNINKANKNRSDNFSRFISLSYPYIKIDKEKESSGGGLDKLIKDYYKIFGKPKQNQDEPTNNKVQLPEGPVQRPPNLHCGTNDRIPRS
jgi:hypothetical protein